MKENYALRYKTLLREDYHRCFVTFALVEQHIPPREYDDD